MASLRFLLENSDNCFESWRDASHEQTTGSMVEECRLMSERAIRPSDKGKWLKLAANPRAVASVP
jgi:hypothetical protein